MRSDAVALDQHTNVYLQGSASPAAGQDDSDSEDDADDDEDVDDDDAVSMASTMASHADPVTPIHMPFEVVGADDSDPDLDYEADAAAVIEGEGGQRPEKVPASVFRAQARETQLFFESLPTMSGAGEHLSRLYFDFHQALRKSKMFVRQNMAKLVKRVSAADAFPAPPPLLVEVTRETTLQVK